MSTNTKKIFLITGCSSGLGKAIAKAALAKGHSVIATARGGQGEKESASDRLKDLEREGAIVGHLDVEENFEKIKKDINSLINKTSKKSIDILINNAGYILQGGIEECSNEEIFQQFDINVFGSIRVTQAVLPFMRNQRSGIIVMLGSLGSWRGFPGSGYYCATKACCSIIAESLREEVEHLGIKVTSIEPGRFRTAFLTEGSTSGRRLANKSIEDLEPIMNKVKLDLKEGDNKQPGDPEKAANLIIEALTATERCKDLELPHRLVLGPDAVSVITGSIDLMSKTLKEWHSLSMSTDY